MDLKPKARTTREREDDGGGGGVVVVGKFAIWLPMLHVPTQKLVQNSHAAVVLQNMACQVGGEGASDTDV